MGLHYVFGYVGYETRFASTFVYLLDNFCSGCHTNRDVEDCGGCSACPIGQLIFKSKAYILDAYESDILKKETKLIRQLKKEIKPIVPHPLFNATFIFEEDRKADTLDNIRSIIKELEFEKEKNIRDFHLQSEITKHFADEYKRMKEYKRKK